MHDQYDIVVDELDEATCWRLLTRARFGRVGFVDHDEIAILPVNIAAIHERIVFRTGDGTSLAAAGTGAPASFEADHTDPVAESGWSVLVRGRLFDVTDRAETATWTDQAVRPWAPPPRNRWMMIEPTRITGRMIQRHRILRVGERAPYMAPD